MPRKPELLTPILDAKDDFTICRHFTRLEVNATSAGGRVLYYQEQPAFTPVGVPFNETNAQSGHVYQRLETKAATDEDFVLVPEGAERKGIIKVIQAADSKDKNYGLYAEIDGQRISLRGGSSPSLALYTHRETGELWVGKSELLDAGARESRLELLDGFGRGPTKNALLKEIIAYDIFAYYGASVPRLSIASAVARYKNAETQLVYDDRQTWHWHIFSRWLDKFRTYGYLPQFSAADPHFSLIIDDRQIRERGLGHILAVAHFINDVDAMNNGGNNVGYQLKTDAQGELYAQSYKIDPAWAFTGCQEEKPAAHQPTRSIHVSNFDVIAFDNLPSATQAEFIETLQLISETPDRDIERFFNRGTGLSFTHISEPRNLGGPTFVYSAVRMLKARRNVLSQLFAKELQAAKTANATRQPLVKPTLSLSSELAPIYTHMQYEQTDPLVQQARHFYISPNTTHNGDKTETTKPLQVIMDGFLADNTQRILLLLGDSGFGKSTTTQIFYQHYWQQYLASTSSKAGLKKRVTHFFHQVLTNVTGENEAPGRITLRIELKQFTQRTVLQCVQNTLKDIYHLTENQIQALKKRPCLILLDGFDEIAGRLKCNLWQSNQLYTWRDVKLLITCRSVYLEQADLSAYFYPSPQQAQALVKRYLAPITFLQIEAYLRQVLTDKPATPELEIKQSQSSTERLTLITTQIVNSNALQELLEIPLLLKIFTDALPTLEQQGSNLAELNRYTLYQAFMQQWFNRHKNRLSQHLGQVIDQSICQRFLDYSQDLAFELFKTSRLELDYAPGQAPWDRFFSHSDSESIYLRSGCPLRRMGNRYSFIHKSFFEFFIAQKILRQAEVSNASQAESLPSPVIQPLIDVLLERFLSPEREILNFLHQAAQSNQLPPAFISFLFATVQHSAKTSTIAIASSNAATILNACEIQLMDQHWPSVQLPQADLSYCALAYSDLKGANLRGANLTHCMLYQVNLEGADLRGVQWGEYPFLQMEERVAAIAHHPLQPWIAIAQGKTIVIKNRDTDTLIGQPMVGHLGEVTTVVFSPDGSTVVSGSNDHTLRLWDTQTQQPVGQPMKGHSHEVTCVAFSPDGKKVVSGSEDRTVRLWDTQTQKSFGQPMRHTSTVISVVFTSNGSKVMSGSRDYVHLWNTQTQQPRGQPMAIAGGSKVFSSDGSKVVSRHNDKTVRLWDVQTQQPFGQPMVAEQSSRYSLTNFAFSPSGSRVVGILSDTVYLWNTQTQQLLGRPMVGHSSYITSVAFSPDGSRVISGSHDQTVRLWDTQIQPLEQLIAGHTHRVESVAFSSDGRRAVSGGYDQTVRLWDAQTQQPIGQPMVGHVYSVGSVAFNPDGSRVVSTGNDQTVRLWDTQTQQPVGQPMKQPGGLFDGGNSAVFSSDGNSVVSQSGYMTMYLWDIQTQQSMGQPAIRPWNVANLTFSLDGSRVMSGSGDKAMCLWDTEIQQSDELAEQFLTCHLNERRMGEGVLSPDGTRVVASVDNNALRLWDIQTQQPLGQLMVGHSDQVTSVAFSSSGNYIVSGSKDKTIRLWDMTQLLTRGKSNGIILLRWHTSIESLSIAQSFRQKTNPTTVSEEKSSYTFSNHNSEHLVSDKEDMLVIGDEAGAISFWAIPSGLKPPPATRVGAFLDFVSTSYQKGLRKTFSELSFKSNPFSKTSSEMTKPCIRFLGMPKHLSMPLFPIGTQLVNCQMSATSRRLLAQNGADVRGVIIVEENANPDEFSLSSAAKLVYESKSSSSFEVVTESKHVLDHPMVLHTSPHNATVDLITQQQALVKAVLDFVFAVDAYINTEIFTKTQSEPCDANAAASYVGTVISALAKGQVAYEFLLQHPESNSIPAVLLPCILNYIQSQPLLLSLQTEQHQAFARQLKNNLSRGQLTQLVQQYGETSEEKHAANASSSLVTSTPANHVAFFPDVPSLSSPAVSLSSQSQQAGLSNDQASVEAKFEFS